MKKIYTLAAAVVVALSVNAQNKSVNNAPKKLNANPKLNPVTDLSNFRASTSNGRAYSGWLNYALQLDDALGYTPGAATADFMLVYPDTNLIVGQYTDGSTAYPQFHKAATMLDPKNMPVQGIASTDAYSLDSIGIVYGYLRSLSSAIVDTLRVDIVKHVTANEYTLSSGETYQDITYNYLTDKITASEVIGTYYYYLTEADSSSFAAELYIKTTLPTQAAGNRIGAVVTFKPGFTATVTDSIQHKNSFYILSYEQNGASTDPIFYGTANDGTSDLNASYAIPSSVRYNTNANGWNGYLIPTWAWTTPFADEHHLIEFKISAPPTGIDELSSTGIKFDQNYPNPFSSNSVIKYELAKNAKITLSVFDVTGKKVMEVYEGEKSAGNHSINVNAENLSAGVYYYSIRVNENTTSTVKMVVVK